MTAADLNLSETSFPDSALALDHLEASGDVAAADVVKALFAAFKEVRDQTRAYDKFLLGSEGELAQWLRGLGLSCTDDEVVSLLDQYGRSYCWE